MTFSDVVEAIKSLSSEEKLEIQLLLQQYLREERREEIYQNFQAAQIEQQNSELNNPDTNRPFCAAAIVSNIGSEVTILKEEKYFSGHKEADDYYHFGFSWVAGSK